MNTWEAIQKLMIAKERWKNKLNCWTWKKLIETGKIQFIIAKKEGTQRNAKTEYKEKVRSDRKKNKENMISQ